MNCRYFLKNFAWSWGTFVLTVAVAQPSLSAQHFNGKNGAHSFNEHAVQNDHPMFKGPGMNQLQPSVGDSFFQHESSPPQKGGHCGSFCSTCSQYSLRTFGGWNFLDIDRDFNRGWALGGSVGRYVQPQTRLELEFTYRHNAGNQDAAVQGNLNSYSLLTNLVYELSNLQFWGINPYIGGGIGISLINGSFTDNMLEYRVDDPVFAYQGLAGVQRKIGRNASMFGEYRYFGTANVDFSNTFTAQRNRYSAENVFIGVQFNY